MRTRVQRIASRCFISLRQLRSVRRQVPGAVFQSFATAFVLGRLKYCNSVLVAVGLSRHDIYHQALPVCSKRRLMFGIRRSEHITYIRLICLQWRHVFKVVVLAYRALNGSSPNMLSCFTRVADADKPCRRRLRSSTYDQLLVPSFLPPLVAGVYLWNDFLWK